MLDTSESLATTRQFHIRYWSRFSFLILYSAHILVHIFIFAREILFILSTYIFFFRFRFARGHPRDLVAKNLKLQAQTSVTKATHSLFLTRQLERTMDGDNYESPPAAAKEPPAPAADESPESPVYDGGEDEAILHEEFKALGSDVKEYIWHTKVKPSNRVQHKEGETNGAYRGRKHYWMFHFGKEYIREQKLLAPQRGDTRERWRLIPPANNEPGPRPMEERHFYQDMLRNNQDMLRNNQQFQQQSMQEMQALQQELVRSAQKPRGSSRQRRSSSRNYESDNNSSDSSGHRRSHISSRHHLEDYGREVHRFDHRFDPRYGPPPAQYLYSSSPPRHEHHDLHYGPPPARDYYSPHARTVSSPPRHERRDQHCGRTP